MKLNASYNILILDDRKTLFLISSDDDIRSVEGDGLEDVYSVIELFKRKGSLNRGEIFLNFSVEDKDYIDEIINWLLDDKIIVLVENRNSICAFYCRDKDIIKAIRSFYKGKFVFISSLEQVKNVNIDLIVVIYPFAGLKEIFLEIDKFSFENRVKVLYADLYEKCINIGPLVDFQQGTCSIECMITRKLNSAKKITTFKKFIATDFCFENYFVDTENYAIKASILLLINEIEKILNNNDTSLYNNVKRVDFRKFELEKWGIIKDYNSTIFNRNINIPFNG